MSAPQFVREVGFRVSFGVVCLLLAALGESASAQPKGASKKGAEPDWAAVVRKSRTAGEAVFSPDCLMLPVVEPSGELPTLMMRELARQALLMAARDELGLSTRDRALREPFGAGVTGKMPIEVVAIRPLNGPLRIALFRRTPAGIEVLHSQAVPLTASPLPGVAAACEALSREQGPTILRKAGYVEAAKPKFVADAAVPPAIEKLVQQYDVPSQFAAVREMHAEIRRTGESAPRLSVLARGYVNLGVLTEFAPGTQHKVFKARGLLYAQRAVVKAPDDPSALWTRAYVWCLLGTEVDALNDFESARVMSNAQGWKVPVSIWVAPMAALITYDVEQMEKLFENPAYRPIARFANVLLAENRKRFSAAEKALKSALEEHPACLRAVDSFEPLGDLDSRRLGATLPAHLFSGPFAKRLKEIPGLPASVAEQIPAEPALDAPYDPAAWRTRIDRLLAEGALGKDRQEPSWAVLGQAIWDSHVRFAVQRLTYSDALDVKQDDGMNALLEGHPLAEFLGTHGLQEPTLKERLPALRKSLAEIDIDVNQHAVVEPMMNVDPAFRSRWDHSASGHADLLPHDSRMLAMWYDNEVSETALADELRVLCPNAPRVVAARVQNDWKTMASQAEALEKRYKHYECVLWALAWQFDRFDRPDDAERCLKAALALDPSPGALWHVADFYRRRKKHDVWEELLVKAANTPGAGLEQPRYQAELADHYIERRQWDKALPYALSAAESYASFGLLCAARCYEGMENWTKAEEYVRRNSERYDSDATSWFAWCRRTGKGDAAAARKHALAHLEALEGEAGHDDLMNVAMYYRLIDEHENAFEVYKAVFDRTHDPRAGLHAALLADRLKKPAEFARLLERVTDEGPKFDSVSFIGAASIYPKLSTLLRFYHRDRGANPKTPFPAAEVKALRDKAILGNATRADYLIGDFLLRHGSPNEAREFLLSAATSPVVDVGECAYASVALRDMKVPLPPRRSVEVEFRLREDNATDREVAQWIVAQGGTLAVRAGEERVTVDKSNPYPAHGAFVVVSVRFEKSGRITDADVAKLAGLKSLEAIAFADCGVTGASLKALEAVDSIRWVQLRNIPITDADMAAFRRWTKTTHLEIENAKGGTLTNAGVAELKGLTLMESLRIAGHRLGDPSLETIGGMTRLQELSLGGSPDRAAPSSIRPTDAGLAHLAGLTELRKLSISSSRITDAGLKSLERLRNLRQLHLDQCDVKGEGFAAIPATVTSLSLARCPLQDARLADLTRLATLADLSLVGAPITDAGLTHLARLKTVKRFVLTSIPLSKTAVASLQKAVPKALIVTTSKLLKP